MERNTQPDELDVDPTRKEEPMAMYEIRTGTALLSPLEPLPKT